MTTKFTSWTNRVTGNGTDVIQTICRREDGVFLAKAEAANCPPTSRDSLTECATLEDACIVCGWPHEYLGLPKLS